MTEYQKKIKNPKLKMAQLTISLKKFWKCLIFVLFVIFIFSRIFLKRDQNKIKGMARFQFLFYRPGNIDSNLRKQVPKHHRLGFLNRSN